MRVLKVDLPYLCEDEDRHGNERLFVRRFGRKIRMREEPGSKEFLKAYEKALDELGGHRRVRRAGGELKAFPRGTLGWLAARYFDSAEFKGLDAQSQATRRGVIEECLREPFKDDDPEAMGNCPLAHVSPQKVKRLRDLKLKAGLPGAANNRKKYLSAMFAWAVDGADPPLMQSNPCRDVKRVRYATSGFHTWEREEVEQFRARHPIGTKARLALEMLLFIGVRRGDFVTLGRQHVKGREIRFVPRKTRFKRARTSVKPFLPELAAVIAQSPCGDLTLLVTEYGQPFTAKGFGNWFRERCDEAGLHQCTAHGLRKIGATIAAENGATVNELMAMFDWDTPAQAKVYTDAADRKRLAAKGMPLIAGPRS